MDYTYQFDSHLREHRPSRLGQRLWWIPAVAGVAVVVVEGVYLATTPSGRLSAGLAVALPYVAAFLFLVSWAALSIADWTYPREKYYREAHHAAAAAVNAYILAGRRARGELRAAPLTPPDGAETRISLHAQVSGRRDGAPTDQLATVESTSRTSETTDESAVRASATATKRTFAASRR